ncbi:hypothetical protein [Bacillus salipaludis]|uniref:Uncharacterized protein n=1 Tax=Bacillus salipaludis TaxID=2547811 RepID=A0AA90TWH2_9BACI|nr:hypothetical protein [Bacillus salipaludis]MDQ6600748.1 hypothetical protein [Bacillus salipaludis]
MSEVTIEIHYSAGSRITQKGSFPLRGKRPEQVALAFWKQIRKEMSYHAILEKVLIGGGEDITQLVKVLQTHEWRNVDGVDLPF